VPHGGPDDYEDPRGEWAEDGPDHGAADPAGDGDEPGLIPGLAAGFRPDPVPGPGEHDEPETSPGEARRAGQLPWPGQAPRADRPAGADTVNRGSQGPRTGPPRRSEPGQPGQPGQRGPAQRSPEQRDQNQRRPEQERPGTGQGPGRRTDPGRRSDPGIVPGMSRSNEYDEYGRRRTPKALPPGASAPVSVSAIASRVWGQVRRQPLEAAAVVVLILGVLIFPPLWLIGVFIALLSRLWNLLDKMIGLAGPVLLTIIGTGVGLAMGAKHSPSGYFKEGLALSTDLFRAGAILGAIYLAWRITKGRRQESTPPWMRPTTRR
jgi:hypothetical protein